MTSGESIQVEEGKFARIHNDILTALSLARLSGAEYRCLMFLFRQTYGWQRKEDTISLSQWAVGVGIDPKKRHNVLTTLQGLVKRGVIYARETGKNRPMVWGFNKYIEQWDRSLFPETVMLQHNTDDDTVIQPHNTSVMPQHNETVMQAHNHKRKKEKKETSDDPMALLNLFRANGFVYLDREALALAAQLIEQFGWDRCVGGMDRVKAAHTKQAKAGRRGIAAPLAYLRSILEEDEAKAADSDKGFETNAWETLANNDLPDYMRSDL